MPMLVRIILAQNKMTWRIRDKIVLCPLSLLAGIMGDAISQS